MKKIMSLSGAGLLAISLLMTSCVSKKKYVQAQNTIEQYRQDSIACAQRNTEFQTSISGLEEKNRALQTEYDSTKKAYETRWATMQTYYDEQKASADQLHQEIHQSLSNSDVIDANDIKSSNGRVYVTLDQRVFTGNQLNSKGKQAVGQFSNTIKGKDKVAVDVVTGDSYAAYWNTQSGDMSGNTGNMGNADNAANADMDNDADDDAVATAPKKTTAKPATTVRKKTTTTTRKSTATTTRKRTDAGRKMAFKSGTKSKSTATSNTFNNNLAKATALAKELHKNGVYNVGLMIPGNPNDTKATSTENSNKFQLIVTPKSERYFQMIEKESAGNTSMNQ